jgi:hypothetical protein
MATISKSFTAVGSSDQLLVRNGDSFTYDLSGTFVATLRLQVSGNGGLSWENVTEVTAATSGSVLNESRDQAPRVYRWNCTPFTSGTAVTTMVEVDRVLSQVKDDNGNVLSQVTESGVTAAVRPSVKRLIQTGAKVGGTAEFLVNAADNKNSLARLPASKTAATLVVPVSNLKVGDTITGFHLVGQIESAGGTVTVDADLRKQTAAASDLVDASVGAITQLSVIADTIISSANSSKSSLADVVGADETFYVLITATTGASCDIDLQAVAIVVTEA